MITITKEFTFDAAHILPDEKYGKCSQLHGHTYKLEVTVASEELVDFMVMNFSDLKKIIQEEIITPYDHTFLNDSIGLQFPTAEAMLEKFQQKIRSRLPFEYKLISLTLWETPTSKATWTF